MLEDGCSKKDRKGVYKGKMNASFGINEKKVIVGILIFVKLLRCLTFTFIPILG